MRLLHPLREEREVVRRPLRKSCVLCDTKSSEFGLILDI